MLNTCPSREAAASAITARVSGGKGGDDDIPLVARPHRRAEPLRLELLNNSRDSQTSMIRQPPS